MKTYRIALIGLGNVAQGFLRILTERAAQLEKHYDLRVRITAVSDLHRGSIADPEGFDPHILLKAVSETGRIDSIPAKDRGWDAITTIHGADCDLVAELAYTNLNDGQPALDHIRTALSIGKHVITTNKGPIALHYPELADLAAKRGLFLGIEGTVMSGTPCLRWAKDLPHSAGIEKIEGILNGTSNFILTNMETGADFEQALLEAQRLGYAEADPSGDVDGHDVAGKVAILANQLLGADLDPRQIECRGIRDLTAADLATAASQNRRWKLLGQIHREEGHIKARVAPVALDPSHPLHGLNNAQNGLTLETQTLGQITILGPGAGKIETGMALISDLISLRQTANQTVATAIPATA